MLSRRFTPLAAAFLLAVLPSWPPAAHPQEKNPNLTQPGISVKGITITPDELSRAAAAELEKIELQRMQSEANYERGRHQAFENALVRLVEARLLSDEAAKRGLTSAQLLVEEVDKKVPEPSDQDVDQFYTANKARIPNPKEQVAQQIRQYLKQQNYTRIKSEFIERLKKANGVSYSVDPLRVKVEAAGYPARGPENAPVIIVEFSDFQCSFCKTISSTLEKVLSDFSADVRLVYRQFPLSEIHPQAQKAAEASLCAAEQGKFWQMHDLMFQEQGSIAPADLKAKAARLGLDTGAFNACLDSGQYVAKIRQDLLTGARLGVTGTPALFINGRFVSGARPFEEIAGVINEELQRKKSTGNPGP